MEKKIMEKMQISAICGSEENLIMNEIMLKVSSELNFNFKLSNNHYRWIEGEYDEYIELYDDDNIILWMGVEIFHYQFIHAENWNKDLKDYYYEDLTDDNEKEFYKNHFIKYLIDLIKSKNYDDIIEWKEEFFDNFEIEREKNSRCDLEIKRLKRNQVINNIIE
jgi:hypothetical protein